MRQQSQPLMASVVFSNKVTSTSNDGLETNHILIQGDLDVSRKISVSDVIPTEVGNVGDIVYHGEPVTGGTLGWVYSYQNEWVTFGSVGLNPQGDTSHQSWCCCYHT